MEGQAGNLGSLVRRRILCILPTTLQETPKGMEIGRKWEENTAWRRFSEVRKEIMQYKEKSVGRTFKATSMDSADCSCSCTRSLMLRLEKP